jgi:hypothetical protein
MPDMDTLRSPVSEADILEQVVAPAEPNLPAEAARALLGLRFNAAAIQRMNELAEKNRLEALTESERSDLEKYLRVGNFVNLIHAKARISLANHNGPST